MMRISWLLASAALWSAMYGSAIAADDPARITPTAAGQAQSEPASPPAELEPSANLGVSGAQTDQPVDISSDAARVNEANRTVVLTGNVIAKQGDVTLQADTVTVHYLPGAASGDTKGKIDRLIATGNVVVTRPGEVVKGDSATYKMIEKQILMSGNVIATRAGSVVRGNSLTVDLVKETIQLQAGGQSGRVRAIFTPPASATKP